MSNRIFEIFCDTQQVLAVFKDNTVLKTYLARCAETLIMDSDSEYDIYEHYYDENYNLIRPEPSQYSDSFVSLNPFALNIIGDYTLCVYGGIKKHLKRIYADIYSLSDGKTKYMMADKKSRIVLFNGVNIKKIKHLEELIPSDLHLSGVDFENSDIDDMSTETVFDVGNNRFAIYADGDYCEVYPH
jgi:hypothetical protein